MLKSKNKIFGSGDMAAKVFGGASPDFQRRSLGGFSGGVTKYGGTWSYTFVRGCDPK